MKKDTKIMMRFTLIGILFLSFPVIAMDPELQELNETQNSWCQLLSKKVMSTAAVINKFADKNGISQDILDIKEGFAINIRYLRQLLSVDVNDDEKGSELSQQDSEEYDEVAELKNRITQLEASVADKNAIIEALQEDHPQEK